MIKSVLLLGWALLIACPSVESLRAQSRSSHVLILGGGTSHDFIRNYQEIDSRILAADGFSVRYVETFAGMLNELKWADVFIQASNQAPDPDQDSRRALLDFVEAGHGLIIVHAGVWYNWASWPQYNRALVGGGSHGHDEIGEFTVNVGAANHPILEGIPKQFRIRDELYHEEIDPAGSPVEVLATATSLKTGKIFPSLWVVREGHGRIVCLALGHDEQAHNNPAYVRILENATRWVGKK